MASGAGVPNYLQLHQMGRLPKEQRDKVFGLKESDELEKLKADLCDDCKVRLLGVKAKEVKVENDLEKKCEVVGCDYMGSGRTEGLLRNSLRMHMKTHTSGTPKEEAVPHGGTEVTLQ